LRFVRIAIASVLAAIAAPVFAASVTVTETDRTMGAPLAPVTVIEYASPSCPHCARFDAEVLPLLKRNYIDRGKVLFVFRVFPRQPVDGAAEGLARCVPPDRYFDAIAFLFRTQHAWDPELGVSDVHGALLKIARSMGLGAPHADMCMSDKANAERLNRSEADAVREYGIHGTPTLVINGRAQPAGVIPWPQLQQMIDKLAK
jgi:protein-disulfide isomerase